MDKDAKFLFLTPRIIATGMSIRDKPIRRIANAIYLLETNVLTMLREMASVNIIKSRPIVRVRQFWAKLV
jgi:hypothetical protein